MTGAQGSPSVVKRRKYGIAIVFALLFIMFCYFIRERYFYRADVLIAIQADITRPFDNTAPQNNEKEEKAGLLSYFGFGGGKKSEEKKESKMNAWDRWMSRQVKMTSIGDIYNRCDNKTRTKIGKVVLQQKSDGNSGVQIKSYLNQTYDYEITSSKANMEVYFNDELLYTKHKDMCEAAKELDTPYTCPVKAGHTLVIQDVAKLPSYIPKGKYRVFSNILDQNNKEIGCTYIEFKTGET